MKRTLDVTRLCSCDVKMEVVATEYGVYFVYARFCLNSVRTVPLLTCELKVVSNENWSFSVHRYRYCNYCREICEKLKRNISCSSGMNLPDMKTISQRRR